MRNKKIYAIVLLASSLFCSFIFILISGRIERKDVLQVSFFYRGSAEEYSGTSLKQGIDQAVKDMGIELTVQFLNNNGSESELIALLEKEAANNLDAILIEPVDGENVYNTLKKYGKELPVILVNTGFEEMNEFPLIACNYRKFGQEIGMEIQKGTKAGQKVLMVTEPIVFQDIRDTCAGIEESLKGGCEVEYLILAGDEHKKEEQISKRLAKGDIHAVMALGCSELEILGRVYKKETSLNKVMIYGMGKNNDIIADMEEGLIQAVGVINYYSIGYLSVQEVVRGGNQNKEILTAVIDKDEIFTPENQRLLFTLVQ